LERRKAQTRKRSSRPSGSSAASLSPSKEGKRLALAIAAAGLDIKASSIEIIDVCGKVDYTEFLVLMTGGSDRHVHAIAKSVQGDLKKQHGAVPLSVEGMTAGTWVLLDYNDVVVHVFQQSARLFYDLEGLWMDASRVALPEPSERPPAEDGD